MWYGTVKLARAKNVTIIKLPPHTTDLLQLLDVAVFKSLKDHWGEVLFQRLNLTRARLSKAEFLKIISSEVWNVAFSAKNIESGFMKCGIIPSDRYAYPQHRFNGNLLNRYKIWWKTENRSLRQMSLTRCFLRNHSLHLQMNPLPLIMIKPIWRT